MLFFVVFVFRSVIMPCLILALLLLFASLLSFLCCFFGYCRACGGGALLATFLVVCRAVGCSCLCRCALLAGLVVFALGCVCGLVCGLVCGCKVVNVRLFCSLGACRRHVLLCYTTLEILLYRAMLLTIQYNSHKNKQLHL